MKGKYIISLFMLVLSITAFAQQSDQSHVHENHNHGHEHHMHELGMSFAPVYFINEAELSFATHFHYTYNFPDTKFGLGLGYERIFDEHRHNFVGVELAYRPTDNLIFNIAPGLSFEDEHTDERDFAVHFETVYEFVFDKIHLGPLLELAYHPEDFHVSMGLHVGYGL